MQVKVKYHSEAARPITQAHSGEWCDLRAAEDTLLKAGGYYLIPLGVSIQVPEGYEAIMAPRSSASRNFGILQANNIGVIDQKYCGENDLLYFPAYATRDAMIAAGDRIAQFRIQKTQGDIEIVEVEHMENEDRGGFGSTGVK